MSDQLKKFHSGAVRSTDADDVRFDLISPIALTELARTYAEGAQKYGDNNWLKGIPRSDLLNHALRHIFLYMAGDTSEPHLPHAMWNIAALIHFHHNPPYPGWETEGQLQQEEPKKEPKSRQLCQLGSTFSPPEDWKELPEDELWEITADIFVHWLDLTWPIDPICYVQFYERDSLDSQLLIGRNIRSKNELLKALIGADREAKDWHGVLFESSRKISVRLDTLILPMFQHFRQGKQFRPSIPAAPPVGARERAFRQAIAAFVEESQQIEWTTAYFKTGKLDHWQWRRLEWYGFEVKVADEGGCTVVPFRSIRHESLELEEIECMYDIALGMLLLGPDQEWELRAASTLNRGFSITTGQVCALVEEGVPKVDHDRTAPWDQEWEVEAFWGEELDEENGQGDEGEDCQEPSEDASETQTGNEDRRVYVTIVGPPSYYSAADCWKYAVEEVVKAADKRIGPFDPIHTAFGKDPKTGEGWVGYSAEDIEEYMLRMDPDNKEWAVNTFDPVRDVGTCLSDLAREVYERACTGSFTDISFWLPEKEDPRETTWREVVTGIAMKMFDPPPQFYGESYYIETKEPLPEAIRERLDKYTVVYLEENKFMSNSPTPYALALLLLGPDKDWKVMAKDGSEGKRERVNSKEARNSYRRNLPAMLPDDVRPPVWERILPDSK